MTMTDGQAHPAHPAQAATAEEVRRYLADVAAHLGRLDPAERAELLDDLEQHLLEVAAEPGPPLQERLGPPAAYAAELLASVGVDPDAPDAPGRRLRDAVAAAARALATSERTARARQFVRELYPAWLLARGAMLGVLVAALLLHERHLSVVVVCMAAGVAVSLGVARRRSKGWRRAGAVFSGAVVVLSVPVAGEALDALGGPSRVYYDSKPQYATSNLCLTNRRGDVIENLYPYDKNGQPLDGVLLYDQTGQPIDNLCPARYDANGLAITTTYARDVNGATVVNTFPRPQTLIDPRSGTTAPVPRPAIVIPKLAPTAPTTSSTSTSTTTPTSTTAPTTSTSTTVVR